MPGNYLVTKILIRSELIQEKTRESERPISVIGVSLLSDRFRDEATEFFIRLAARKSTPESHAKRLDTMDCGCTEVGVAIT
jgi:hypothetical protein